GGQWIGGDRCSSVLWSSGRSVRTTATASAKLPAGGGEAAAHWRVWPSTGSPTAVLPPFNDLSSKPTNPSTPMVTRHTPMAEMVVHHSTPSLPTSIGGSNPTG